MGVDVQFDEQTSDSVFQKTIDKIERLTYKKRDKLKQVLVSSNQDLINLFFIKLENTLDRQIEMIVLIPLHGQENQFETISDAITFVANYEEHSFQDGCFRKYEIVVRYGNGDKIEASLGNKEKAIDFLRYIEDVV